MALVTGERIDECHLISVRGRCERVWVYANGRDVFVPLDTIRDCWEVVPPRSR
jgi:hypothetical protein